MLTFYVSCSVLDGAFVTGMRSVSFILSLLLLKGLFFTVR